MSVYPVTVVVGSLRGWPVMGRFFDDLAQETSRVGGRLIVADGSGVALPADARSAIDRYGAIWLDMPGAVAHALRQAGYRRANSDIVVITEDHVRPAPGWLANIISAHAADPGAAVIVGGVDNGSPDHLVDWAVYCVGYGVWAAPIAREVRTFPGHANVSWKRWALDKVPAVGDRVLEFRQLAALRDAGERLVSSDAPRVTHYQCDDIPTTVRLMYNNGRAIAGLRRDNMGLADWLRAMAPVLVGGYRTVRTLRIATPKPELRRHAVRSLPLIAMLHLAHACGEAVGYALGVGDSARHLH